MFKVYYLTAKRKLRLHFTFYRWKKQRLIIHFYSLTP